jgi:hypothetical protein
MNKRFFLGAFILCLSLVMMFSTTLAQNPRIGTAAATELLIPVGGRDFAMGGASLASSSGVEAIHWNPAGLSRMQGTAEGMFSTMSYIGDIKVSAGAVAAAFGSFGVVGLSLKSLDFGDIPVTTVEDSENKTGASFSPSYIVLGLTYSKLITNSTSVGVTVKLFNESIPRAASSGVAFDLGLQYAGLFEMTGLQLGVTVKNIGPETKWEGSGLLRNATSSDGNRPEQKYMSEAAGFELPSLIDIGLSYSDKWKDFTYLASASYTNNNLYVDEYRLGAEIGTSFDQLSVAVRGGYSFLPQITESSDRIFGFTLGFGVSYLTEGTTLTLDWAYRDVEFFDGNNVLSLKIGF